MLIIRLPSGDIVVVVDEVVEDALLSFVSLYVNPVNVFLYADNVMVASDVPVYFCVEFYAYVAPSVFIK